jgi:hypothetical protein
MAKELRCLIVWPEREEVQRNLPGSFRRYYKKCRCIIDCTEFFIETPTSLIVAAKCWSNYKHHYTAKVLIGITPNGSISFVSDTYGGRASDIYIVKDSNFLNKLQPGDQIMADRGFKISELLAFQQCSLAIPPSTHGGLQLSKSEAQNTSRIANVRIYVENAIRRIKEYNILSREITITLLPVLDDIITICSALTNLRDPLCM